MQKISQWLAYSCFVLPKIGDFSRPPKKNQNFLQKYLSESGFAFTMKNVRRAFLSSSVVERSTVNRLVAGSNPAWGVLYEILC